MFKISLFAIATGNEATMSAAGLHVVKAHILSLSIHD